MLKKLTLGIVSALMLGLAAFGVQAQDAVTAGEPVTGELTEDAFAVEYLYNGTTDEVIVITLSPTDVLGDLNNPAIIVRDAGGAELLRYDGYGTSTVVLALPESGEYTIVATRTDDAAGTSVGEYTLTVTSPQELAAGDSADMTLTSEETNYFVYRGDADFTLSYTRDGEYAPEVTVNTLDTDVTPGSLDTVATVGGKLVTEGSIGVIPGQNIYVIKVGQALFDFYFETVEANYTLTVTEAGN
jgi:hypothetical protein